MFLRFDNAALRHALQRTAVRMNGETPHRISPARGFSSRHIRAVLLGVSRSFSFLFRRCRYATQRLIGTIQRAPEQLIRNQRVARSVVPENAGNFGTLPA
jgi:hypothetical protein